MVSVARFYSRLMDALARQTFLLTRPATAPPGPCSNLADVVRRVMAVGEAVLFAGANFNASEKGQTSARYFADHFAPVRETPQDITSPPRSLPCPLSSLVPFITSHVTGSTQFIPSCPVPNPSSSGLRIRNFKGRRATLERDESFGRCQKLLQREWRPLTRRVRSSFVVFRVRFVAHESQRCLSSLVSRRTAV